MRATEIVLVLLWFLPTMFCTNVDYDHRALVIDGKRRVLISGSIHYPRSTPQVLCLSLILFMSFCIVFDFKHCWICCCCYYRCGQTLFRNLKMEDLMSLKPMFSGTYMNLLKARFSLLHFFSHILTIFFQHCICSLLAGKENKCLC